MLEEEKHERPEKADRVSAKADTTGLIVRPLCGCFASSDRFVVLTCPLCMGVALRAMEALDGSRI